MNVEFVRIIVYSGENKDLLLQPGGKMLLKRDISPDILAGARYFPVIAILGPRQSGKTTLAQALFKDHTYVSLEDPEIRAAAIEDPRTFLLTNRSEHGMIIDEFQYLPDLLSYIQTIVDKEQKPGYFILTGSQNFLMNSAISQSLAGRVSIHTLLPLSIYELDQNNLLADEVEKILYKGCYPAIYAKGIPPTQLYKNYLQTYIERDVRLLTNIGDLNTFQKFITLCAARIGQLVNLTSLGADCGISDHTVKRWLSILQASYIIFLAYPYHNNFGKRLIKTPKIFFYDPGLVCELLRIDQDSLAIHPMRGGLFESFIMSEMHKWFYNHGKTPSVHFWRDQTGHELDCILEQGTTIIPIEIKASRTMSPRFFDMLEFWTQLPGNEKQEGFVIYGASKQQVRARPNLISWQSMDEILKKLIVR